ncbi:MAG TPA: hypothetical protein DEQ28_02305 [Clostridiales bacterium]|nr:hypothetical protein [Clostridiales bacterium]
MTATEAQFAKVAAATRRRRQPLRGAAEIGLRVGKVRNKYKVGKHFDLEITEDSFRYARKAAEAERTSIVQKAERSKAAKEKAATKRTADGFTVESFRCLLSNLATIVKNRVRPAGTSIDPFVMMTIHERTTPRCI